MISMEEAGRLLDEIVDGLPRPLFRELNGGVWLSEDCPRHAASLPGRPLYVMGEYQQSSLGRTITLYYGSFAALCGGLSQEALAAQLRSVLLHELTHHNESLAGLRDLEEQDAQSLSDYLGL